MFYSGSSSLIDNFNDLSLSKKNVLADCDILIFFQASNLDKVMSKIQCRSNS